MKKSSLLAAVCAITLGILTPTTHAAVINPIFGLDIGGTLYDVIFHDQPDDSFNELWDADDDGVFSGGGSLFSTAPTFWGNEQGAIDAASAIMQVLGDVDATTAETGTGRDGFMIPWGVSIDNSDCATVTNISGPQYVCAAADATALLVDTIISGPTGRLDYDIFLVGFFPYASFQSSPVPLPTALWLFGSGLLGFIGVAKKQKATQKDNKTHTPSGEDRVRE